MCVHKEQGCPALTPLSRRLPAYAYKSDGSLSVSILLNHHFGCLDDGRHGIALLQPKFFRTATGDDTLNHILTHSDNDVSHDVSQNKLLNSSTELVPCRDWHTAIIGFSLTCLEHRSSSHLVFCLRFHAVFPANAAPEAGRSVR